MCQHQVCPSNAIDMPHMPISSGTHETLMSVYISDMNSMQSTI